MYDGGIVLTKIPNYGLHVNVTRDITSSENQVSYNIVVANPNTLSYIKNKTHILLNANDYNNKIVIQSYTRANGESSYTNSENGYLYINNISNYNSIIIRFYFYNNIKAQEYDIYPSILIEYLSDTTKLKLNYNGYLDTNSFRLYLNEDGQFDIDLVHQTSYIFIPNSCIISNSDIESRRQGSSCLLITYKNSELIYTNFLYIINGVLIGTRYYNINFINNRWIFNDEESTINPDNDNSIDIYETVNFINCEHEDGHYYIINSSNQLELVERDDISAIYIPIPEYKFKYILLNTDVGPCLILDENKNILHNLSLTNNYTVSPSPYQDITNTFTITKIYYIPDNMKWEKAKYILLPIGKQAFNQQNIHAYNIYICLATSLKLVLPQYGYNTSDKLIFNNDKIINKTPVKMLDYKNIYNVLLESIGVHNGIAYWKYYDNKGDVQTNTNFISTDTLYIPAGTKINFLPSANMIVTLRGFDSNGPVYYSGNTLKSTDMTDGWDGYILKRDFYGKIVISFNTWNRWQDKFDMNYLTMQQKFQFVSVQSSEEILNNPWKDKHWYAYGTSITDIGLKDTTGNSGHSGKYPLYLDIHSGMIRYNGAIGSGGILNKDDDNGRLNVKKNILSTPVDADLVTLEVLPNDSYANETLLGDIDDISNDTIMGNLNQCLDYLVNNTHARIVFIFVTASSSDRNSEGYPMYDSLSANRKAYRNAVNKVKELAELYGCYCIDVDKELYPYEMRGWGNLFADWIHPSYLGGWLIGQYVWKKLKEIGPMVYYPEIEDQTKSTMEWSDQTS